MRGRGRILAWFAAAVVCAAAAGGEAAASSETPVAHQAVDDAEDARAQARLMALYERMVQFNLHSPRALPAAEIDSLMAGFSALELGARIAAWAEYFYQRGDAVYRFGLDEEGYVTEGRLIDDFHTDCVLFCYRVTELGRSSSALEAVQFAFGTRFYGAVLGEVVDAEGRVDYENSVHLDYTIDMIRSGIWGQEITATLGETIADAEGSTRYAPGTVDYVDQAAWKPEALRDGDIVYFVSDPATDLGRSLREAGAIIGHLGIIKIEAGRPMLIHAAARGLSGLYAGGQVEKVDLATYLSRVENFRGLIATRIISF
jgi:hypothetical protein